MQENQLRPAWCLYNNIKFFDFYTRKNTQVVTSLQGCFNKSRIVMILQMCYKVDEMTTQYCYIAISEQPCDKVVTRIILTLTLLRQKSLRL